MGRSTSPIQVPDYVNAFSDQILAVATRGVDTDVLADAALARSARIALARQMLTRGKVTARVRHGWLTLQGEVTEPCQKRAAQQAVETLRGVHGITNNIAVESDELVRLVQRRLAERFADNQRLRADHILVTIHDRMAILTGAARSEAARQEADAAARSVAGIAAVVNQIRVNGS